MKHIYVSPHADDVALSCGGQIIANPTRHIDTMVLTVFTSETPDAEIELNQGAKSSPHLINRFRMLEDRKAWENLGVPVDHLNMPEALLRNQFPFAIFHSRKADRIAEDLYNRICLLVSDYPEALFYFPAGFGNHVDHLACTRVAFRLLDEGLRDKITLYEDIPYCWLRFLRRSYYKRLSRRVNLGETGLAQARRSDGLSLRTYLTRSIVPFPNGRKLFLAVWISLAIENVRRKTPQHGRPYRGTVNVARVNGNDFVKKKELLFDYKSQIPMLFGSDPEKFIACYSTSFETEVTIEVSRKH